MNNSVDEFWKSKRDQVNDLLTFWEKLPRETCLNMRLIAYTEDMPVLENIDGHQLIIFGDGYDLWDSSNIDDDPVYEKSGATADEAIAWLKPSVDKTAH